MSIVEYTKTIISTIKHIQTVNSPTTVSIYPTPSSSLNKTSLPSISSTVYSVGCPACTPSTVIATAYQQQPPMVLSNVMSSCPACRPSTVTTTIYQQSPVVLSNMAEIGILTTSAVLICLPILALVIVTYCWVRTRRTVKKKRSDPEMKFVYLAQDR